MNSIILAGGCFWGIEKYLNSIYGVISTEVGYANGKTINPTYEQVCSSNTDHAEVVKVEYDSTILSLKDLLFIFYKAIDPTTINRQGGDTGRQYRTGIYYTDPKDLPIIQTSIDTLQKQFNIPIVIEIKPLENYYKAEEYHQKYLDKNTGGYCHIKPEAFKKAASFKVNPSLYSTPEKDILKQNLSQVEYEVTQQNGTEPPFENPFWNHYQKGIYVDITSGEPLFISNDKFQSECGWPSFSQPIDSNVIKELNDSTHGMVRTEVRSRVGDAHLGHVFTDGPEESGGLRYCINSAALRFIPLENMESLGYAAFIPLIK